MCSRTVSCIRKKGCIKKTHHYSAGVYRLGVRKEILLRCSVPHKQKTLGNNGIVKITEWRTRFLRLVMNKSKRHNSHEKKFTFDN